jgi:sugar lactone lactonase YvrE/thiol-disulfide isomerase/thioredoxin
MATTSFAGDRPAPEFPPLEWLNVEKPLSLSQLRGKVVLLDFWTYGCINCLHVIPQLKRLEAEFPLELAVIGVHSAKFAHEGDVESIRQIIRRYELEHPVANDRDYLVWRSYHVRAWPTIVVIDPAGNYVGSRSGEDIYEAVQPVVRGLIEEFDARGALDRRPLPAKLEEMAEPAAGNPAAGLRFPGRLLVDQAGGRLFVADSNNDRLLVLDLDSLEVEQVFGGAAPGFADGEAGEARFFRPQGLALSADGRTLYVADTENHSLRRVDLATGTVHTLSGNGMQTAAYPGVGGPAAQAQLNSPWDLELVGEQLYVAMAGSHQIWRLDLALGEIHPWVGSGAEGIDDGPAARATLAQPSGLTSDGNWLYFADPESSAIRAASLESGQVRTLVGTGLFDFGDVEGPPTRARLQHPLGLDFRPEDGLLYVSDTYNHKLKTVDPASGETRLLAGGERGQADGAQPLFNEPGGVDAVGGHLYVADTNNHALRRVSLDSGETETLRLHDPRGLLERRGSRARPREVPPAGLRAGEGVIRLRLALPPDSELSPTSPLILDLSGSNLLRAAGGLKRRRLVHPSPPLEIPALFRSGSESARVEIDYSVCPRAGGGGGLCRPGSVSLSVPVEVGPEGESVLDLGAFEA